MLDHRFFLFPIAIHFLRGGLILLLLLGSSATVAAAQLVNNGSFEEPVVSAGKSPEEVAATVAVANVPGWKTDRRDGRIQIRRSTGEEIRAFDGAQFLEIEARPGNQVYQDIPTVPGRTYRWGFAYRARSGGGEFLLLIDDQLGVSRLEGSPDRWTRVEGTHLALGTVTRIEFRPAPGTRVGSLVDAVTFEEIRAAD